jgi:hypothetical protein
MAESTTSSEFFLGIEEYLRFLKFDRLAENIHSLSRTIDSENAKESVTVSFLQDFTTELAENNVNLADLTHGSIRAETQDQLRTVLLHYLAKTSVKNQNLTTLIFALLKADDINQFKSKVLKFCSDETEGSSYFKDLIFHFSKLVKINENAFKFVLQFIGHEGIISQEQKDLIFSQLKGNDKESFFKSLLQYIGKSEKITQEQKDLIFAQVKSDGSFQVYKTLLHYVGSSEKITQEQKDLIFSVIKIEKDFYSFILEFIGKSEKNADLSWFAFAIKKCKDFSSVYQIMLQMILKVEQDLTTEVKDLIHGCLKENRLISIRALLLYLGKVTKEDHDSMASLSMALHRAVEANDFEKEVISSNLAMLDRKFLSDKIFRGINVYIKSNYDQSFINDAFSRSQIKSKIWLVEELTKINSHFANVLVLAGWFGQIKSIYNNLLTYNKMRIVDIDRFSCNVSDYIFNLSNLEEYKVKSVCADINSLTLHKNGYELNIENFKEGTAYLEKFLPDLIINTSAEHMTEEWFNQIRFKELESNPIVAMQSNNLFDIEEHVNCVYSIDHLKKKFPMKEILFEGELQLKGYKRVMLIGRP